jgi:predicted permease
VVAQLAISLLLLVGAGLAVRSLNASRRADVGFDPHGVVSLSIDLQPNSYDERGGRLFYQRLLDDVRARPGIESSTLAARLPLTLVDGATRTVTIEGYEPHKGEDMTFLYNVVAPGYFDTLRIGIVAGRAFERRDDVNAPPVVIVNETMARKFWNGPEAAIGERLQAAGRWWTVSGVVRDIKYARVTEDPRPHFYLPFFQRYQPDVTLQVRGGGSTADLIARVRTMVQSADPNLPILDAKPLDEQVRVALFGYELAAGTLLVFGPIAIGLAAIGLYGLVAFAVEQGRHEIGICLALGASRADVLRGFLARGVRLGIAGTATGALLALALTRLMSSVLYRVGAADPRSFAAGAAIVMAITVAASFLPAWKASHVDPMSALRRH